MSATLDKMKQLIELGLPTKLLMPVMEIIEGVAGAGRTSTKKKRRKRRTREQMLADAAKVKTAKKRKKKAAPST